MPITAIGKKIFVAGKEYSEREWKRALNSNQEIFKVIAKHPNYAGPHLYHDEENEMIEGDTLGTELATLNFYGTDQQRLAYEDLRRQDEGKAAEYLLTIVGAMDRWKEDIKVLRELLYALRKEERVLVKEERTVERAEVIKTKVPDTLKKHLPEVYRVLKRDFANLDVFLNDLQLAVKKITDLENLLDSYLTGLQAKGMKFLFE